MRKTQISWGEKGHYKQELEKSYKLRDHKVDKKKKFWNGAGPYGPCPPQPPHSSVCLVSVESFSQRISLIREMKSAETKETVKGDQIIIM